MREFEVQLVDGGPDHAVEAAAAQYPFVRYTRIDAFCTMHRKRNLGVGKSRSALVVFSDPDVVADEAWLEKLVACWRQHQRPIAGAIACFGNRLTDRIVHLIKFDYWLVRGETRSIDAGATANMLVSREQYDAVGGFDETTYLGDLKLSRDLSAAGYPLIFCPEAVVEHDHERVSLLKTVREHWRRGARVPADGDDEARSRRLRTPLGPAASAPDQALLPNRSPRVAGRRTTRRVSGCAVRRCRSRSLVGWREPGRVGTNDRQR